MERDIFGSYLQKRKAEPQLVAPVTTEKEQTDYRSIVQELRSTLDEFAGQTRVQGDPAAQYDLAIVNGQVVIPDEGIRELDIYVSDGKVAMLGARGSASAKEVIDARGLIVMPGVIDPHVHIGIYRSFEQEIISESRAALAGGVTTMGCFLGSETTHFESFPKYERQINLESRADVVPHLVISTEQQKNEVEDYVSLMGVSSFKIYMSGMPGLIPDVEDGFALDMLETLKGISDRCVLCVHAENKSLIAREKERLKVQAPENMSLDQWRGAHPDYAEEEACLRMAYYAKLMEAPVYLVHISTARAMEAMIQEKRSNPYLIVETTSPYLATDTSNPLGRMVKMIPPIGSSQDRDGLWEGLFTDTVDTIGTDHVSIKREDKASGSFWDAKAGYSVLETHLPSLLHEGYHKRGVCLDKLIAKITKRPAEKFNLYPRKGTIQVGSDADLVIVDLNKVQDPANLQLESLADFTIYDGQQLKGWPIMTIKGGRVVAKDGKVVDDATRGTCIRTI